MQSYLLDYTGDLLIVNGTFVQGDTAMDIVADLAMAMPGEFKEDPVLGCGLRLSINGAPDPFFKNKLMKQAQAQGIDVKSVVIEQAGINITLK